MDPMCSPEKPHHDCKKRKKLKVQSNVHVEIYMIITKQILQQPTIFINFKKFGYFSGSAHAIEVSTGKKWHQTRKW